MTLLRRYLRERERRGVQFSEKLNDLIRNRGLPRYAAGQHVNTTTSRRVMAVWRCQQLLADMVGGLPIDQYRRLPGGRREEVEPAPFLTSPSQHVAGSEEWRFQVVLSAAARGNAYALITEFDDTFRFARRAEVLDPEVVTVKQPNGALAPPVYMVENREVDPATIMHFRAYGPAPGTVLGLSPIDHAAWSVGFGLASRDYAGRWYEKGGHPTGMLTSEHDLEPGEIDVVKERHRTAVEEDGILVTGKTWKWTELQPTPEQAAFLESMGATAIDIAGYYGLPPELLGYATEGSSVTYANREQRMIDVLVTTLQWWIGRMERFVSAQLPAGQFAKINIDALLRSDTLTRYKVHDLAVRGGLALPNERRLLEDQPPLPEGFGDEPLWPPYSTTVQAQE